MGKDKATGSRNKSTEQKQEHSGEARQWRSETRTGRAETRPCKVEMRPGGAGREDICEEYQKNQQWYGLGKWQRDNPIALRVACCLKILVERFLSILDHLESTLPMGKWE